MAASSSHRAKRGVQGCRIAAWKVESFALNSRVIWRSRFRVSSSDSIVIKGKAESRQWEHVLRIGD
jgi:hypothetical protein